MVEDLALASLGLGDEALVEDVEDILADLLELELDLLAVLADDADVLVGALGLLLLLDAGDDAPGGTAGADDVLVGDGKEVALVNCELAADLCGNGVSLLERDWCLDVECGFRVCGCARAIAGGCVVYLCDFLFTCQLVTVFGKESVFASLNIPSCRSPSLQAKTER